MFSEGYNKGTPLYNTDRFHTFAEIHEMADKPGFIGKEIPLSRSRFKNFGELKENTVKAAELIDKYLGEWLPKYYFTFKEQLNGTAPSVIFFMEKVVPDQPFPPAKEADSFLAQNIKMYSDTQKSGEPFMVDIKPDNLVFGHTKDSPQSKLYFIDLFPTYFPNNSGLIYEKLSEFAKVYGPNNLPLTSKNIYQIK